jgi:hypothetical protein
MSTRPNEATLEATSDQHDRVQRASRARVSRHCTLPSGCGPFEVLEVKGVPSVTKSGYAVDSARAVQQSERAATFTDGSTSRLVWLLVASHGPTRGERVNVPGGCSLNNNDSLFCEKG